MPNQRAFLLRISLLREIQQALKEALETEKDPKKLININKRLRIVQGRISECRDWLEAITEHDDYGQLYQKDGRWIPKVPELGEENIEGALENKELGIMGENRAFGVAARERRHHQRSIKVAEYIAQSDE